MVTPGQNRQELDSALRERDEQLGRLRAELAELQREQGELVALVAREQELRLRSKAGVESRYEQHLRYLQAQLAAQQQVNERLERESASLRAKNRILMQALAARAGEVQRLQQDRTIARAATRMLVETEQQRDALAAEAAELRQRLELAKKANLELLRRIRGLEPETRVRLDSELQQREQELTEARRALGAYEVVAAHRAQELMQLGAENEALQARLASLLHELEEVRAGYLSQGQELAEEQIRTRELGSRLLDVRAELEAERLSKRRAEALQQDVDELQQRLSDQESTRQAQAAELQGCIDRQQAELRRLADAHGEELERSAAAYQAELERERAARRQEAASIELRQAETNADWQRLLEENEAARATNQGLQQQLDALVLQQERDAAAHAEELAAREQALQAAVRENEALRMATAAQADAAAFQVAEPEPGPPEVQLVEGGTVLSPPLAVQCRREGGRWRLYLPEEQGAEELQADLEEPGRWWLASGGHVQLLLTNVTAPQRRPAPGSSGHEPLAVTLHHEPGCRVEPADDTAQGIHVSAIGDTRSVLNLPATASCDRTSWRLGMGDDEWLTIELQIDRLWWALADDSGAAAWVDRALPLELKDLDRGDPAIWLLLPRPGWARAVRVALGTLAAHSVQPDPNSELVRLPLRELCSGAERLLDQPGRAALDVWVSGQEEHGPLTVAVFTIKLWCRICNEYSTSQEELVQLHIASYHYNRLYTECFSRFDLPRLRRARPSLPLSVYRCGACGHYERSEDDDLALRQMVEHARGHGSLADPDAGWTIVDDMDELHAFWTHLGETLPEFLSCDYCGELFQDPRDGELLQHLRDAHRDSLVALR